jgi:hypothetical protein
MRASGRRDSPRSTANRASFWSSGLTWSTANHASFCQPCELRPRRDLPGCTANRASFGHVETYPGVLPTMRAFANRASFWSSGLTCEWCRPCELLPTVRASDGAGAVLRDTCLRRGRRRVAPAGDLVFKEQLGSGVKRTYCLSVGLEIERRGRRRR